MWRYVPGKDGGRCHNVQRELVARVVRADRSVIRSRFDYFSPHPGHRLRSTNLTVTGLPHERMSLAE